jgi:flagellar protein FlbD
MVNLLKIMIKLTRLNGEKFILNAIYIEVVNSIPDTTISLTNGKKVMVQETEEKVTELVTEYYQKISILGGTKRDKEET